MSRARYQRPLHGNYEENGMLDGWQRPLGTTPPSTAHTKTGHYMQRGVAIRCRYYVAWIVADLGKRSDLHCNFDDVQAAIQEIADHPDVPSGGIWDTRDQRWVL